MFSFFVFKTLLLFSLFGSSPKGHEDYTKEQLTSRFLVKTDPYMEQVNSVPLRSTWWSRFYEYPWAEQFAGPQFVVLDAGCGISHPFKWYLQDHCKETWACDTDRRLMNYNDILQETYNDLGEAAYFAAAENQDRWKQVHFTNDNIFNLPDTYPKMDRIFCISVLEHLLPEERAKSLRNFARTLKSDGLLILTVDYPAITPEKLLADAAAAGLVPAGPVIGGNPPADAVASGSMSVFVSVLRLKSD